MKTAAAYIRVSTDDQLEYSPESQIKNVRDFARKNDLILPDEFIFRDDGISGKDAKHRPAFNRMIALAKSEEHPFDVILVWKFSRFARNQEESIVIKNLLKRSGVEVRSISEPVDPDSTFGSLIERIIEWMDEYYLINLSGEVKRGMLERVSRGEAVTPAPFGYQMENGRLIPHPEEAPIVQEAFASYLAGEGLRAIAMRLGVRGVRTHRGNVPDNRFVEYMLHNPIYIGKLRWSVDGRAASRRKYDDPNILLVDGIHAPIIEQETFDAVQNHLAAVKRSFPKYQRPEQPVDFMLKGLVRCSACGATLCHSSTKTPSLQCHNYARGSCRVSHYTTIDILNRTVIAAIEAAMEQQAFTLAPRAPASKAPGADALQKALAAERRKLQRIRAAYENGTDTLEEYAAAKAKINASIRKIEEQIAAAAPETAFDPAAFTEKLRTVLAVVKDPDQSQKAKNEALRSVIDHIIFHRSTATVDITFYA